MLNRLASIEPASFFAGGGGGDGGRGGGTAEVAEAKGE